MLFLIISFLPFILILSKPFPLKSISLWLSEMFLCLGAHWFKEFKLIGSQSFGLSIKMSGKKKSGARVENVEESGEVSVLDLPELVLDSILGKLSPAGLSTMAGVCRSLRERCRSDHVWEMHMKRKWGRVIGAAAHREWQAYLALKNESLSKAKDQGFLGSLSCLWPLCWVKSRFEFGAKPLMNPLPDDSIMSWYLSIEKGKFWFPAQVYNREHGHVGFMLSCYDAQVCYDCHTDTFTARYPPHGRRTIPSEGGVQWERLRAPPVDTSAHELHISDCLNELRPGDHIEIQWRRNKEFPYGWWYGVVGHLESCNQTDNHCQCHNSDTITLEFNQYSADSRWRRTIIDRNNHLEEGNETEGFYGGVRKLNSKDEIAIWKQLWPPEVLE
ncbi:F-box domain-containing protein [Dioscorea alata]|uniref:F-box domain-containing protein n=1 Tax=Dioscorea alata TaxID=55571 RepID=A0ACB7VRY7_DIOAL|nr:F-box domain-containing protein [Dioscorea alata]